MAKPVGFRVHFQHQTDQQSLSKYSPIKLANIQSNFIVYNAKLSQAASQKKKAQKSKPVSPILSSNYTKSNHCENGSHPFKDD
jgi:hypothetical protein